MPNSCDIARQSILATVKEILAPRLLSYVGIEQDGFSRAVSGVPLSVTFHNSNNGEFYPGLS
jgi:hypothetical protein